jgi:hypothetical protein
MASLNKSRLGKGAKHVHRERTVNFIQLWDEILTANVMKNNSNYGETRTKNMYVDMIGFYSGEDNVTYVYSIDGYPKELEISYRSTLRSACKAGVRISFVSPLEQYSIDWNSPQMKARLRTWRTLANEGVEVDEYNLHENLSDMDSQDWKKDSLVYLSTAEIRRKRKMFKFRSIMFISGQRGQDFNDSVKEIVNMCKTMNIKISRIIGDIPEYLKVFSPFSNTYDNKVLDQCGCITIPDELLARFNTYAQGMIGREGIYWGTDIFSSFPCLKPVKRTTETAENWLITAETGGGKSFFVKGLLIQLLAKPTFNGTIMDIEGFEYIPLADYLSANDNVVILNMGEGTGAYYDPVEIVVTGNQELDADMYSLSSSFTLSLFKCLLGTTQSQDEWIDIVINDAVSLTYGKAGVDASDMSTWGNSAGFTLYDVYNTLKSLKSNGDAKRAISAMFTQSLWEEKQGIGQALSRNDVNRLITSNDGYQKAIDMCIAKISRYFEPNGIRAHLFRKRIAIDEIQDAKLVICSFGMAGKSPNTVDPIQMALMQLYSANISHLRSVFSKKAGKFNFKLWEEFQRWGGFPDADKTINVALTGGRKLGDVNIIVTNKVIDMLKDDKFGVFSNITSIAIGCIWDAEVREDLCNRLTIPQMKSELDTLVTNNKDLSAYIDGDTLMTNPYSKAFLIGLDKTVYTLSRMSIPKGLRDSHIFRTGVDLAVTKGEEN